MTIGVNAHLKSNPADLARTFAIVREKGFDEGMRVDAMLRDMDTVAGRAELKLWHDLSVASGVELFVMFKLTDKFEPMTPDRVDRLARIAVPLLPTVRYFEADNEIVWAIPGAKDWPRLQPPESYDLPIIRKYGEAAKAFCSAVKELRGDTAKTVMSVVPDHRHLTTTLGNMGVHIDCLDPHMYIEPDQNLEEFWRWLRERHREVVFGEANVRSIDQRDDQQEVARNLPLILTDLKKAFPNARRYVYSLFDSPQNDGAQARYGIMKDPATPKPAFDALEAYVGK